MALRGNRSVALAGITLIAALVFPASFAAQPGASQVSGTVTDSSGIPIIGASVSVPGTTSLATTDEKGQFQLSVATAGQLTLSVRRLGFAPLSPAISVKPGQPVRDIRVKMSALPGMLRPVLVRAVQGTYTGRLAGYYTRLQRRSGGYFISRDEIDRKSYRNLSQLLRNIPGINAFPMKSGGGTVRMRERQCRPLVWLDGVPMPAAEVDLDAFPVNSLHGIEAYPGTSNTPNDFLIAGGLGCGTIALWSRGADTDPVIRPGKQPADLEQLIAAEKAFSADQVDQRAALIDPNALTVMYPPELLADGLAGSVLVEYVVDAAGVIERETISVVSSSHPLFSAAVNLALKSAAYRPAMKAGSAVRQIVQQPFNFLPNGGRTSQGLK